ncbi:MAG: outer membrane protein assembly factor BamE [Burkholderiales bacterium]|nr:outer membrane protein assembly factor BamE [Burkholderiales bacterium]
MLLSFLLDKRPTRPALGCALGLLAALSLGACSTQTQQRDLTNMFKPYRIDVIQGNFVSREMAAELQPGMTKQQVRNILGTPLLQDVFHADRWEYVFSLRQGYGAPIVRRFTVLFDKDGRLLRTQGDPLPSEDQFVAQINALHTGGKTRVLTTAQLQAETAAAAKKLEARAPAQAASEPGPLTVVAPPAEIEKLKSVASQADASVLGGAASAPAGATSPATP